MLERRGREREGKFLVEGLRLVREAVKKPGVVKYIMISCDVEDSIVQELSEQARAVYRIKPGLIKEISDTQTPSGIVAVCYKLSWDRREIPSENGLVLIVDNVRDPGNLGTILRTSWAVGVHAVFLLKGTVDVYNPKVVRSSMGAVFFLPVFEKAGSDEIRELFRMGYRLLVADPKAREVFIDIDYSGNVALVVGGETTGISRIFEEFSAVGVRIPLRKGVDSLNAAVACGIILYEAWRKRELVCRESSML